MATKKTTRTKEDTAKTVTRQEALEAFASYAAAESEASQINARLDEQINDLRSAQSKRLLELENMRKAQLVVLKGFAKANKELFAKKRSMELQFGKIGFRTGNLALTTLNKLTWDLVLVKMQEHEVLKDYVVNVPEIQKAKLIADREGLEFANYFEEVGIAVTQKETFFVEPKKEALEVVAS